MAERKLRQRPKLNFKLNFNFKFKLLASKPQTEWIEWNEMEWSGVKCMQWVIWLHPFTLISFHFIFACSFAQQFTLFRQQISSIHCISIPERRPGVQEVKASGLRWNAAGRERSGTSGGTTGNKTIHWISKIKFDFLFRSRFACWLSFIHFVKWMNECLRRSLRIRFIAAFRHFTPSVRYIPKLLFIRE